MHYVLTTISGWPWVYESRSKAFRDRGQRERALADIDQALALQPDTHWILAAHQQLHQELDRAVNLRAGQTIEAGQSIWSPSNEYRLTYQNDGNLVLYRTPDTPLWASNTPGISIGRCVLQGDGNLVIYDALHTPVWSSDTWRDPDSRLELQDNGHVTIRRTDGTPIWTRPE